MRVRQPVVELVERLGWIELVCEIAGRLVRSERAIVVGRTVVQERLEACLRCDIGIGYEQQLGGRDSLHNLHDVHKSRGSVYTVSISLCSFQIFEYAYISFDLLVKLRFLIGPNVTIRGKATLHSWRLPCEK